MNNVVYPVIALAAFALSACQSNQATQSDVEAPQASAQTQTASVAPATDEIVAKPSTRVSKGSAPKAYRSVNVNVSARYKGKSIPAACTLDSPYETLTVTAPGTVQLRDYSTKSPQYQVVCKASGYYGTAVVNPVSTQATNASAAGGLAFGIIGAVVTAASVKPSEGSKFTYHDIRVKMQKTQ